MLIYKRFINYMKYNNIDEKRIDTVLIETVIELATDVLTKLDICKNKISYEKLEKYQVENLEKFYDLLIEAEKLIPWIKK